MEQVTPRLRKTSEFYELDGEPLRRAVGRPRTEQDPCDLLWETREFLRWNSSAVKFLTTTPTPTSRFGGRLENPARAEV